MQSRFKTSLGQPQNGAPEGSSDVTNGVSSKLPPAKPYSRPKSIGRYKIIDDLGRGAMAYVYKAYDPEIDRFLAVKVLREELANDNDYRSGFIHEAKLAGQLAHPGIVTVYDVGVADDKPYIAMELLDGQPLDELLKKRTRLSLHFVISIMVQLTRALHYAHKQGVTHRDIKPGNIICLADNKTVKLTDFGIAQLDDSLASAGKTQEKVLGTPEYMAPEQVLGHKLDARSDLYSLGTLIYTMVTGTTPFNADDYGELFRQIIKDKPADMVVEDVAIPDELQDIVRKLLSKQPEKRYQSAAELMRDIRELLDVLENSAKEQARPGFVSLRLRWTLGMAGLVFLTMLTGLVVVYYQQFSSMRSLATDYGYSTNRLIAFEVAEPLLLKDATALEAIVNDLRNNQDIDYINIRDINNVVVASTKGQEVGERFTGFANAEALDQTGNASIYSRELSADQQVLDIDSPIAFQNKEIGRVLITISADKLVRSTKLTLLIMIILMIVTLLAVFFMTLAFARQISAQSTRLALALERMRRGQFNRRLTVERNDEFGRVSIAFNQMAESLEKRFEKKGTRISGDTEKLLVTKPDGQEAKATDDDVSTVILEKKLKP
ncbi:MAG: protein kinase [Gammaproteobacteria bacterium]|nr:protein kinase [Gammaproteobacteria bacterium]NVK87618.1 protein kinase [Gammaproteobacteria bacterium]